MAKGISKKTRRRQFREMSRKAAIAAYRKKRKDKEKEKVKKPSPGEELRKAFKLMYEIEGRYKTKGKKQK